MARVLIVDDSDHYRETIRSTLNLQGHEVFEAENPLIAFEVLDKNWPVDIAVVDFNMPEMDGLTFIEKLRENDQYKELPTIMCTTESNSQLMKRSKKAGVKVWLIKPYSIELFLSSMQKILNL